MRWHKNNSYYYLYAALILLPLILSAVLFFMMRPVINELIEKRATQTSMQFYVQTSGMIRELHTFSSHLADDTKILQQLNSERDNNFNNMDFCDYISSKAAESRDISHVYVVSERYNNIFTNEGCYTYDSLSSLLKRIGLISSEYDFERFGIDWSLYNESGYAPYCVTPVISTSGETLGYIICSVDYSRFMNIIHSLDATICAVYSDNFYISSKIDMEHIRNIDWNDQTQVEELAGEPLNCVYRSDPDYSYMVGISTSEYYQPIRILLIGFGIYFIVVLAAGLLILWRILLRRHHETLQHQQERNLRYILYGYNDRILDDQFITEAGLPKDPETEYVVSSFYVETVGRGTFHDIETSMTEYLKNTGLNYVFSGDLHGPVYIFWKKTCDGSLAEQVNQVCHEMTPLLMNNLPTPFQICTSDPVQGIAGLSYAFHQTADIHAYARKHGHLKPVLWKNDVRKELPEPGHTDSFIRAQQQLINTLLTGKYDQVPGMVSEIQANYIDPVNSNGEYSRTLRRSIANILSCFLIESRIIENNDIENLLREFRHTMETEDLNQVTEKYFTDIAARNTTDQKEASMYEEADAFVKANLHDHNLSVSMICDSLGIGVQKLTRIFHRNNDMAIAEYVNLLRIQESQSLLISRKDLSVNEIADYVGYNNSHSLTRNFRKFTGLTPTEFRELNM